MENIRVAFNILENDQSFEPGWTYLEYYMIFEVKMDFRRKAIDMLQMEPKHQILLLQTVQE